MDLPTLGIALRPPACAPACRWTGFRATCLTKIGWAILTVALCLGSVASAGQEDVAARPNVILCMADDLGWGDTGYNGHPVLRTPNLDQMAREGVRFDRFYSAGPVCSPTRASCVTGRHPFRQGIYTANAGHLKPEEIDLAEVLKEHGYTTGHFGKWHLGTLTQEVVESNRGGPRGRAHYSPPWENGFDACFSTEAKVPTWDPMVKPVKEADARGWNALAAGLPRTAYGTHYWEGPGRMATANLEGDDSRIIMDRAIPFIRRAVEAGDPFLAVIWFHAPHLPVVAGPEYAALYPGQDDYTRNYYGAITALDAQVGRLRSELRELGVERRTMLWFCSDNGPEGQAGSAPGTAGPFRGRKRSLYEGGVRVPGLLVWPERFPEPRVITTPCVTSDYLPTVLDFLGVKVPALERRPVDGLSLVPWLEGRVLKRPSAIGFQSGKQQAWTGNRYKLYTPDAGRTWELYDLQDDPAESRNLAQDEPDRVQSMQAGLQDWLNSCRSSDEGADY
ncbi:MAG: sulfatase-like hydrolase/transferase [Verrucomicrobiales bacterium]|nr:sulfatase-like hydrolase/transferase [Verrucomicrobiales bacterium]